MHLHENIIVLEGRGTLAGIRHKAGSVMSFRSNHLHLGDNLGLILALEKGRSKNFMVLVACRRIAAYSVATGSRFYHRWIASEFNHSDAASRRWEHL
eukprot:11002029-Karenia_brevis.AAC.1